MNLRKPLHFAVVAIFAGATSLAVAGPSPKPFDIEVKPWTFDPANTNLVSSTWVAGLGCPTLAMVAIYPAVAPTGTYNDAGCPTGASEDKNMQGLLLSKTGPLLNNASAGASIDKVKGIVLTELGYDVRGHCGAGAPRFDIQTTTGKFYFLGCTSPAATTTVVGTDWTRVRWGSGVAGSVIAYNPANGYALEAITDPIQSIDIVFDEGTDAASGPDPKGIAILDNIDVNGLLEGEGRGERKGEGKGERK